MESLNNKELPVKTIHESIFWEDDDPKWNLTGLAETVPYRHEGTHLLDMGTDSYIWCYCGGRGAGKTTLMTFFAMRANWLYGYRIISNYPIEYRLNCIDGTSTLIKAEPLDLYKLLCFDNDYRDCLILIDEAPDIVSHMASMTWKNRLINIFIRQLRKNHNSLFLGSQQFEIIDKSMRWQTDIVVNCSDASRKYGWPSSERGKCILARVLDNSGMWTGETWQETAKRLKRSKNYEGIGEDIEVSPCVLWENDGQRPVFDTYFQQDVWESLRKVDMQLTNYSVGDGSKDYSEAKAKTQALIDELSQTPDVPIKQTKFWALANLTKAEKNSISQLFDPAGVMKDTRDSSNRLYYFPRGTQL